MSIRTFDIYLCGVGGQGIGLLSEALVRAADLAGLPVRGVDTHGLAQRGGTVVSHVRIGAGAHSPLIRPASASLVVALERHEALRGALGFAAPGATVVFYDAVWQPLAVRLGREQEATMADLEATAGRLGVDLIRVFKEDLDNSLLQNTVILATLARERLVPGVEPEHFEDALRALQTGRILEANLALFTSICSQ